MTRLLYLFYQIAIFSAKHRFFAAFCIVLPVVVASDIVFHDYLFDWYAHYAKNWFGHELTNVANVDMGFAPEVWLALLSMVLGTLIIVISIASQNTPKLIDLYMEDWTSLFYIWFLIISGAHAAFIKLYGEIELARPSSRVLNLHFFLTISIILAFPYIFYILRYTKPSNIINKIFKSNLERIESLTFWRTKFLLNIPNLVEDFQFEMFEAMNQLNDLLEYVPFKEPKADIIQNMSLILQKYIKSKSLMNPAFFKISPRARSDISFKTLVGQFDTMEEEGIFFEQKCFRLMVNMYINLIKNGEFDLASLCVGEISIVGRVALEEDANQLVKMIVVFFNTFLRQGIKHGARNNEARNLGNAVFHYGRFITTLVQYKKIEQVKQCFFYLRGYGQQIFLDSHSSPSLKIIVDMFTLEMKQILIQVYQDNWEVEIQENLLNELLQVDMPPNVDKENLDRGSLTGNTVRLVQMGLALFYMREWVDDFVRIIIADILDDLEVLGEEAFRRVIETASEMLKFSGPTFWEDGDRGPLNVYYTADKDQVDPFKQRVYHQMLEKILSQFEQRYQLIPEESQLIVKLASSLEKILISQLVVSSEIFEKAILKLERIDKDTLSQLVSLRTKLGFTSKNPDLKISNTRQLAINAELEALSPNLQKRAKVVIAFSYLNYFYLKFSEETENPAEWRKMEKVIFHFKHPLQKHTYQFHSKFEGNPVENQLFKVVHVDHLEVISIA